MSTRYANKRSKIQKKTRKRSISQKGGIICRDVTRDLPAYLILGHGCDYIAEPELPIPDNCVYVTSGICGKTVEAKIQFYNFTEDFLDNANQAFFENPCENFRKLQSYNDLQTNIQYNITFLSYVPKYQRVRQTYVDSKISPLVDLMYRMGQDGKYIVTQNVDDCELYVLRKSGIYRSGHTPVIPPNIQKWLNKYPEIYKNLYFESPLQSTIEIYPKKEYEPIIIPFYLIHYAFLGSVYPTVKQIKSRIKLMSKTYIKSGVPLKVFKSILNVFNVRLSKLFREIPEFDSRKSDGFVLYNMTCRIPCYVSNEVNSQIEMRSRKSLDALNAYLDEEDSDYYDEEGDYYDDEDGNSYELSKDVTPQNK
jgi:hypothetical protein